MYRDMVLDITISHFNPDDIQELRNLMQATIRALLSMGTERFLVQSSESVIAPLSSSTNDLLACMQDAIQRSDGALLELSRPRKYFGLSNTLSIDLAAVQVRMQQYLATFDIAETNLLNSGVLPDTHSEEHIFVQNLVVARRTREAAATVQKLIAHVAAMQESSSWPKLHLPSYPISKALFRTNAQIRHDRGGHVAGSYQVTFAQIERELESIRSKAHNLSEKATGLSGGDAEKPPKSTRGTAGFRYGLWRFLYRLQGYESQYALKVCIGMSLLSIPSYLHEKDGWWDRYEAWWAVALSWILMHTRVGGNLQDLVSRSFFAILGAAWSAAGYAAGHGNPYVMGVFAAIYLIPMTYRFTQSTHPVRSPDCPKGCLLTRCTEVRTCRLFIFRCDFPELERRRRHCSSQHDRAAQRRCVPCRNGGSHFDQLATLAICRTTRITICPFFHAFLHEHFL